VVLLKEFINKLGVQEVLESEIKVKKRARGYTDGEAIMMLAVNAILGGDCLSDLNVMRGDEGTLQLLGWEKCLAATTAGEHLRKFSIGDNWNFVRGLREIAKRVRVRECGRRSCTMDMDASIYEQCSKRKEGSCKAYNGETGYSPLFVYMAETGEMLAAHLMAGNRHPSSRACYLLLKALKSVPVGAKLYFRADSAFYTWVLIRMLEKKEITYAITADMSEQLLEKIKKIDGRRWKRLNEEADVAELRYAPTNQTEHRYVAKRIWSKDKKGVGSYRYYAVITNDEKKSPVKLMKWALGRCTMENFIKEHKSGLGFEKLPTQKFQANYAYLLIGQLAYNLVVWFKQLVLPEQYHGSTIGTIRHRILNLAGKIVKSGRQFFLVMPDTYFYKDDWRYALKILTDIAS
jgi:hypothetical protein